MALGLQTRSELDGGGFGKAAGRARRPRGSGRLPSHRRGCRGWRGVGRSGRHVVPRMPRWWTTRMAWTPSRGSCSWLVWLKRLPKSPTWRTKMPGAGPKPGPRPGATLVSARARASGTLGRMKATRATARARALGWGARSTKNMRRRRRRRLPSRLPLPIPFRPAMPRSLRLAWIHCPGPAPPTTWAAFQRKVWTLNRPLWRTPFHHGTSPRVPPPAPRKTAETDKARRLTRRKEKGALRLGLMAWRTARWKGLASLRAHLQWPWSRPWYPRIQARI
mmetsp:Transcript_40400/g.90668  ORF Transcript_40400/g.90668 Transcript_40400/m.90668 type:complete len:277 (-) Transcript_40400:264-1094(-)